MCCLHATFISKTPTFTLALVVLRYEPGTYESQGRHTIALNPLFGLSLTSRITLIQISLYKMFVYVHQ